MIFKKTLTCLLLLLTINLALSPTAFAQTQDDKEAKREREVQIFVNKLGISQQSKVVGKLKDGKKFKGYISQINDNDFVVTVKKTNVQTTLQYSEVKYIEREQLSPWIVAGIVVGAIFAGTAICVAAGGCVD